MSGSKYSETPAAARPETEGDHLLGLTIYDLPEPTQVMAEEARRTRAGRWKMIGLMLLCAAPVLASYFTFYVIRPEARRNFGELIEPQRALPAINALDLQGNAYKLQDLRGQWLLISIGSAECNAQCVQQLYFQRQLRESLGKDKVRLDRVWLIRDDKNVSPELLAGLKEATVLRVPLSELQAWLTPAAGQSLDQHLFVVDPNGNWMMRFPANMDIASAAKAKRDLERLMRASASWDQPGR